MAASAKFSTIDLSDLDESGDDSNSPPGFPGRQSVGSPIAYGLRPLSSAESDGEAAGEAQGPGTVPVGSDDESDLDMEEDSLTDADLDCNAPVAPLKWSQDVRETRVEPLTEPFGVQFNLPDDAKFMDFFSLFLDDPFLEEFVTQTNLYAIQTRAAAQAAGKPHRMPWIPTTLPEMKVFLAFQMSMGIRSTPKVDDIWSTDDQIRDHFLAKLLSRNRYWALSRYFHLRDTSNVPARDQPDYDPLFKVRPMLDLVNEKFALVYKPKQNLSVDEAMVAFKGRHSFKQYLPSKPTKWGFKVWVIAESDSGYVLKLDVYTGKTAIPARAEARRKVGLGFDVVDHLSGPYQMKNYIITYDNFFSSVALAEHLLSRQTYCNSTVKLNRKGLPDEAKKLKFKKGCFEEFQKGQVLFSSFFDKRQVNHLSSGSSIGLSGAPGGDPGKPWVNLDYNAYMAGVDKSDQHKGYYSVGRKSVKWWKCIVWYFFDLAIYNAFLCWKWSAPASLTADQLRQRKKIQHLDFMRGIIRELTDGAVRGNKRLYAAEPGAATASELLSHHHVKIPSRVRTCKMCSEAKRFKANGRPHETAWKCSHCEDVPLCIGACFAEYHAKLNSAT